MSNMNGEPLSIVQFQEASVNDPDDLRLSRLGPFASALRFVNSPEHFEQAVRVGMAVEKVGKDIVIEVDDQGNVSFILSTEGISAAQQHPIPAAQIVKELIAAGVVPVDQGAMCINAFKSVPGFQYDISKTGDDQIQLSSGSVLATFQVPRECTAQGLSQLTQETQDSLYKEKVVGIAGAAVLSAVAFAYISLFIIPGMRKMRTVSSVTADEVNEKVRGKDAEAFTIQLFLKWLEVITEQGKGKPKLPVSVNNKALNPTPPVKATKNGIARGLAGFVRKPQEQAKHSAQSSTKK